MDIFSHLFVVKCVLFVEKTEKDKNEAGHGTFKKLYNVDYCSHMSLFTLSYLGRYMGCQCDR